MNLSDECLPKYEVTRHKVLDVMRHDRVTHTVRKDTAVRIPS